MTPSLLYDLYCEIRQDKLLDTPGLEEYYLLLKLIDAGHGVKNFDDLAFAIEAMWLKSQPQQQRFREMIEKRRTVLIDILHFLQAEAGNPDSQPVKVKDPVLVPGAGGENAAINPDTVITPVIGAVQEPADNEQLQKDKVTAAPVSTDISSTTFSFGPEKAGRSGSIQFETKNQEPKALTDIPYLFTNDYFPVNNRHLRQAWRMLKDKSYAGNGREIDIEETIKQAARQGYFSALQHEKIIRNQLKLFIFIDRSNSMVAVEAFGRELCNTAIQSDMHQGLQPLYFTEVPDKDEWYDDYILISEDWTNAYRLKKLFAPYNKKNIVVMIYSDAGALNNSYEAEREHRTIAFINYLHQHTAYVTWINPAPDNRWPGTTADSIRSLIPMFEAERSAVISAIAALRGKMFDHR